MYTYMYMYIHTYRRMYTYMHTYHSYLHTYIHACIHTYIYFQALRARQLAEEGDLVISFHFAGGLGGGMTRDVTLFEVFDVFVQCRAAPCEVWRKIKNAFENVCTVAPASKECEAQGGPSTGCPPWNIEIFLEKRVPRTDTARVPPLGGGIGQDEGEAIFGNGHRYKWVKAEGVLVGWTEGLVDIYNTSSHLQRRLGIADAHDGSDVEGVDGARGAGGSEAGGGVRGDGGGNKGGGQKGGGGMILPAQWV
jgi:uncharacterized membrane protein YgcG